MNKTMNSLAARLKPQSRSLLAAVAIGQALVIGYIVADRVLLLRSPTVIELDVAPVDPRSLFRGDYVTLSYPAAMIPRQVQDAELAEAGGPKTVYVTLARDGEQKWRPVRASTRWPASISADEVVIRGTTTGGRAASTPVRFGIESYFIPEGTGKPIEHAARKGGVSVKVAIGSGGRAGIKGLVVDGRTIDEPLL